MVDELKAAKQRARGQEAKRLLENSMIQEFFTSIEKTVSDAWSGSKADEADVRERAYLMMRLVANLKQQFTSCMYTGEIASRDLLMVEQRAEETAKWQK
jgi:hypothetical protein